MPSDVKGRSVAPTATGTLVRAPAVRCRDCHRKAISAPSTKAASRLTKVSSNEATLMLWIASIVVPYCQPKRRV